MTHETGTATGVREAFGAVAIDMSGEGPGVVSSIGWLFARRADPRDRRGIGLMLARRLAESEQGCPALTRRRPSTLLLPRAPDEPAVGQGRDLGCLRQA